MSEWLCLSVPFHITSSPFTLVSQWLILPRWNKHCNERDSWSIESSLESSLYTWKFKQETELCFSLVNPSFVTGVLGVTPVVIAMPLWPGLQYYDAKMCLLLWIFRSYFWKLESTRYGSPVCSPSTPEVGQKDYKFEAIQGWRTKFCLTERNQFPQISGYLDFCLSVLV